MLERVMLMGRLGGDPEMRYTDNGIPVSNISLATTRLISKQSTENCPKGWKESYNGKNWELTVWHRITFWRKQAETINQYLGKGDFLYVEGEVSGTAENGNLNANAWLNKDGEPRSSHEVTAKFFKFLPKGNSNGASYVPSDEDAPPLSGGEEVKLPF